MAMGGPKDSIEAVLAVAPDATLVVDTTGKIVFTNDLACSLFGYTPDEFIDMPVEHLLPKGVRRDDAYYRSRFLTAPHRTYAGTATKLRAMHKNGREFPVELSLGPMGKGPDLLVICTVRDISDRVKVEEQLRKAVQELQQRAHSSDADARRANEHFKLFLKYAPAAIALLDKYMRYLIVSDRWLQDYGLADRDIHGMSHYDVFPEIPERWKEGHRRCLAGEVLQCDEDYFERADGHVDWLRWESHPWRTSDGKIGGMLLFSEVITPRKRAEAALLKSYQQLEQRVAERTAALEEMKNDADRANSQKSWFVAAASHDLRQPLQASLSYLSVLSRKTGLPEVEELCDKARQPLKAMSDILDVLLDISDLESGRVQPRMEDFQLSELLERVVTSAQHQAQEKGLRLSCVATDLWVNTDSKLLERVLSNFVTNAVRYTAKGLIGIYCERVDGKVCISVTDTGIGIPADALGTIFEDHVQLGNPARDRRKGLGLGLSIAKRIADSLGHRISVQSELGSGSSFSIELPEARAGSTAAAAASGQAPAPAANKPIVLLIDDDPDVAEAMQMLLQSYDFETYVASGRDAALAMLESGLTPGLVLCDYRLPGVNGIEVIRQVRRTMNTVVPAVLMTGDMALRGIPADLDKCDLLHKPVEVEQFFSVLEKLGV
jgi:PAS domain S-box-containing protein